MFHISISGAWSFVWGDKPTKATRGHGTGVMQCILLLSTIKTSRLAVNVRRSAQLGSAFIFLRWFKRAHICIQVTTLHIWDQGLSANL